MGLHETSLELESRRKIVEETLESYGVPSGIRIRVKFYLMMKYQDVVQQRSALVHITLLHELMPDVRSKVLAYAYKSLFAHESLFGQLNPSIQSELCLTAKQHHHVRGEVVRDDRLP